MLARMLGRRDGAFAFNELHFYGQLWDDRDCGRVLAPDAAIDVFSRLMNHQRAGYFNRDPDISQFYDEARTALDAAGGGLTASGVFGEFLYYEAARHDATLPVEQTPRDVFYIDAIFQEVPEATVVVMGRAPRAVLLSQKGKWKRRELGEPNTLLVETARAWFNYHPVVTSRLWNAAVDAGDRWADDPRVVLVHFEALLRDPERELARICDRLGIALRSEMLEVPRVSSSNAPDSGAVGIDVERADAWRTGGLDAGEIWVCERLTSKRMERHGYAPTGTRASWLGVAFQLLLLPAKLTGALLLNLGQIKSLTGTIRRRLGRV